MDHKETPNPSQTLAEELVNSILHGLGALLAVAGLVLLCVKGGGGMGGAREGPLALTSYAIFTASMLTMFLASTLYHAIQARGAKKVFQVLDHCAIYFLIAGTYTPFSLLGFRGALGWVYFGIEWALAITGISLHAANLRFIKKAELAIYILMGWACVLGLFRLYRSIPRLSFIFLLAGGLAYTLGTLWYRVKTRKGTHIVWHVFVFLGAALHWFSIWHLN